MKPEHRRCDRTTAAEGELFEALEPRRLLSSASMSGADLIVTGTPEDDAIVLSPGDSAGRVVVEGIEGGREVFADVRRVLVRLRRGDDGLAVEGRIHDTGGRRMRVLAWGGPGDDAMIGHDTRDRFRGGAGADRLIGNAGFDRLVGNRGDDFLDGGRGRDRLGGGAGADTLLGERGEDRLNGGPGPDVLRGGPQGDTLLAGHGRDDLYGGSGADALHGGPARDLFRGHAHEWADHRSEDRAWDDIALLDRDRRVLPDSFWSAIDTFERHNEDVPQEFWDTLEVLQDVSAAYGDAWTDALERAAGDDDVRDLGDDLLDILGDLLDGETGGFWDDLGGAFGGFGQDLLDDLLKEIPDEFWSAVDEVEAFALSQEDAFGEVVSTMERIAGGDLDTRIVGLLDEAERELGF